MNLYAVSVPIAGSCSIDVEANSEAEAKRLVWDKINEGAEGEVQWEYHARLVSGNCLHAPQNEIEVELLESDVQSDAPERQGEGEGT